MPNLGMGELIILLLIVLLVFGASRLPQIGEGLGKAIKGLKRGLQSDDDIQVESRDNPSPDASSRRLESEGRLDGGDVKLKAEDAEVLERQSDDSKKV